MALLDVERAKSIIVDSIAEGFSLKDSCAKAGVVPGNHYVWKDRDVAYKSAYDYALTIRNERLEEVAEVRARDGYVEETTYYETNEMGEEVQVSRKATRKYSDALLMMLLRAGNPGKFDPKNLKDEKHEDDDLIKILASARKRLGKGKPDAEESEAETDS